MHLHCDILAQKEIYGTIGTYVQNKASQSREVFLQHLGQQSLTQILYCCSTVEHIQKLFQLVDKLKTKTLLILGAK